MAITTGDAVPGEVIEAAWGDAVVADLTTLETAVNARVRKSGDTMSGTLTVGGSPGTAAGFSVDAAGTFGNDVRAPSATLSASMTLARNGTSAGQPAAAGGVYANFMRGTAIGSITINGAGNGVLFNTTSDPRGKTTAATRGIDDAAARAQTIGRNAWRGQRLDSVTGEPNGETWDFISSHDVEDAAAYAVTGERDAVTDTGAPDLQKVSYGDLVPLLFAALANALDRIDALEGGAA